MNKKYYEYADRGEHQEITIKRRIEIG